MGPLTRYAVLGSAPHEAGVREARPDPHDLLRDSRCPEIPRFASLPAARHGRVGSLPFAATERHALAPVTDSLPVWMALLGVLAAVSVVAPRLPLPLPVSIALAGVLVGCLPGVAELPFDPNLVLVLFLPPLLYADAFGTSWVDFKRWLRPILMLAIGLVGVTVLAVGLVAKWLLPDLPWPACFILGAIVSPTDTVAVQAVIERLHIPRRITAIVGGESLVNDATGLVGVQIGVAVALSGVFEAGSVAADFLRVAGLGVAVGVGVGWLAVLANRRIADVATLFTLSLAAPYLAYFIAAQVNASGVLAVVIAGFFAAWRIHVLRGEARVQLYVTWGLVVYVLNGLCFAFVGMHTPGLLQDFARAERKELLVAGLLVAAVVIVVRILWCFPNAYWPVLVSPALRRREGGYPSWQGVTIVSWCGARGAVSLAAALSLPVTLQDGTPFPGRGEILACTLCVILVTLFVQASTLSPLIRLLGLRADEDSAAEVRHARETVLQSGIARLDAYCSEASCPLAVHHLRTLMDDELTSLRSADAEARHHAEARLAVSNDVRREVGLAQERALLALRDSGAINDKTYTALQLELDRASFDAAGRRSA